MSYDVSLVVTSDALSLDELSLLLGAEAGSGSHTMGDCRVRDSRWEVSVWRRAAGDSSQSLEERVLELLKLPVVARVKSFIAVGKELKAYVSIASFFDTAYVTLDLGSRLIRQLALAEIDVEFVGYPVDDDSRPA